VLAGESDRNPGGQIVMAALLFPEWMAMPDREKIR
jgi:hypothetical protein